MSVPLWCSLELHNCPANWGYVHYQPSLAGNGFMIGAFSLLVPTSIYLSLKYHSYVFGSILVLGMLSEVIGYAGRILLHKNPYSKDYFLTYLICLTLGPTFMAAAIYLVLARVVVVYGETISRIRPWTYTIIFVCCDVCSLLVQAVGGGIAAVAYYKERIDLGTHIMIAGLAIQVASLVVFMVLCAEFMLRVWRHKGSLNPKYETLYRARRFKVFLMCLTLSTVCIFTRCVFRVAELSGGFAGDLAQDEVSFMVLDGAMVLIACISLTIMHPGIGFKGNWASASFPFRVRKAEAESSPPVYEMTAPGVKE